MKAFIVAATLAVLATPAFAGSNANSNSSSTAISGSASQANNQGNHQTIQDRRQAPGVSAAGLAASGGCLGSSSAGVSFPGGGFSFGSTAQDDRCNAREDARLLLGMGYPRQAIQILVNNSPMVREAFFGNQTAVPAAGRRAPMARRATVTGGAGCQVLSKSGNGQCLD